MADSPHRKTAKPLTTLCGVEPDNAHLAGASLFYADLKEASFVNADLKGVLLAFADLRRAWLHGADRKLSTFVRQVGHGFVESAASLIGLLIQAAVGSSGGVGGLRTNRSGWAA